MSDVNVNFILVFCLICILGYGCSSEPECIESDWIGTYNLDVNSEVCSSSNISLTDQIEILRGSISGTIEVDGMNVEIDGCETVSTNNIFGFTAILNGDNISFTALGCTGTFIRQ